MDRVRVLYDSTCFVQAYGGVSRYYCEMIRNLPKDVEAIIPLKETVNKYLQEEPFNIPEMKVSVHDFVRKYFNGWYMPGVSYLYIIASFILPGFLSSGEKLNRKLLQKHIEDLDFDIYHVTGPNYYNKAWRRVKGKKPIVVTVHDLIFDKIVKDKRVIKGRRELLNAADAIIAVSEYTKSEIISFYGIDEAKIKVTYHGASMMPMAQKEDKGYLLYVGERGGYKNWAWFVRSVAPMIKEEELKLICTGKEFTKKEKKLLFELGIEDRVSARFVPNNEMRDVFAYASAFIYPSKCEGFGLPILEAWANGCPIVLSKASCFTEIARDAALYFNLDDEDGFRRSIRLAIGEKRDTLMQKGYEELSRFSWAKCAQNTFNVYKSVV